MMRNEDAVMNAINDAFRKKDRFRTVKDFLFQVKDARRRIDLIEDRIEYREAAMDARGANYTERLSSGHDFSGSAVEDTVMALDELRSELAEAEKDYADAKVEVSDVIAKLEDINQQSVITRRYISGQGWEKIAVDMDMSVRSVQKLHGRALPILEEILKAREAA